MAGILGPDGEKFIWVMDPMTRKLKVPLGVIEPTQATAMAGTVPSLCMLFLDGRCRHPCCRQVHITLPVLQRLRKDAQQAPNCCGYHGDTRDGAMLTERFANVTIVTNTSSNSAHGGLGISPARGSPIPGPASPPGDTHPNNFSFSGGGPGSVQLFSCTSDRIAMTVGLQRFLAQGRTGTNPFPHHQGGNHHHQPTAPLSPIPGSNYQQLLEGKDSSPMANDGAAPTDGPPTATLEIPLKMVCRLHLGRKCRYLEDCNNVHICRELESKLPAGAGGTAMGPQHCSDVLQGLRPATTAVNVGSTSYNVNMLASGGVSDTDMHQLVTMHKQSYPQLQLRIVDVRSDNSTATGTVNNANSNLAGIGGTTCNGNVSNGNPSSSNGGGVPISPSPGPVYPGGGSNHHHQHHHHAQGHKTSPIASGGGGNGVSPQRRSFNYAAAAAAATS